jgi:hypothetical protein
VSAPDWVVEALPYTWREDLRWTWLMGTRGQPDILWWHPCTVDGMSWIDISSGQRHRLEAGGVGDEEHVTIRASIACHHCSIHGYVTDGKWSDV